MSQVPLKPFISVQVASSISGSQFGITSPLSSKHSHPPGRVIGTAIWLAPITKLSMAVSSIIGELVTGSSKVAVIVTSESAVTTSLE